MNNTIGYYGQPSLGPVNQNPLTSVPTTQINLTLAEVRAAAAQLGYPPWRDLNHSQKKFVAAFILRNRPDATSQAQADQVLNGNPAFQAFTIISGAALL